MGREKAKGGRRAQQGASASKAASRVGSGSDGKTLLGFGGFSGSVALGGAGGGGGPLVSSPDRTRSQATAESSAQSPAPDYRLSGQVTSIFKGFKKRDPVTKIKALQSFRSHLRGEEADGLEAVMGAWSYYYQRLIIENSRQVRLEAAGAHQEVLAKVGKRELQSALPRFLHQWLRSQFDEAADVAKAAAVSLRRILPGSILSKAISHYLPTIVEKLSKDICSPQASFGDAALESKEDIRDRHSRVVVTSLYAIVCAMEEAQGLDRDWEVGDEALGVLMSMVTTGNFGKVVMGSQAASVRQAAYHFVGRMGLHCKTLLIQSRRALQTHVIGSFREKEPRCYKPIFEMVIVVNREVPEMWEGIDVTAVFWPKFHQFLRMGCRGSGEFSYFAILPLLSTIPSEAWEKSLENSDTGAQENTNSRGWGVILQTLDNTLQGARESLNDDTAVAAVAQCFAECLLYFSRNLRSIAGLSPSIAGAEEGALMRQGVAKVLIPFVFATERAGEQEKLISLGREAVTKICTGLGPSDCAADSDERKRALLAVVTESLREFLFRELGKGSALEAHLITFLLGLEPRAVVGPALVSPLAAHMVAEVMGETMDVKERHLRHIIAMVESFGDHLSEDEEVGGSVTKLCTTITSLSQNQVEGRSSLCRLTTSWLNHSQELRDAWPLLLEKLNAEKSSVTGACLLSHLRPTEGIACQALDDLACSLALPEFYASNEALALEAYRAILVSSSQAPATFGDKAVAQVLTRMKAVVRGILTERKNGGYHSGAIFGTLERILSQSCSSFPAGVLSDLSDVVSLSICVQRTLSLSGGGESRGRGEDLLHGGHFADFLGRAPDSSARSIIGGAFACALREFASKWSGMLLPEERTNAFIKAFANDLCKGLDVFEDSTILDQICTLVGPHPGWPLRVDPATERIRKGGSLGETGVDADGSHGEPWSYAAFLLALLTHLRSYESVFTVSCENLWIPIELACSCAEEILEESQVYEYMCILREQAGEGDSNVLERMYRGLKENLVSDFQGHRGLGHATMIGPSTVLETMSLLLRWMEDLCPQKLPILLEGVVGGDLAAFLEPGRAFEAARVELVLVSKVVREILLSMERAGSKCRFESSKMAVFAKMGDLANSLAPTAPLGERDGLSLSNLLEESLQASVLAAQILSEAVYRVGCGNITGNIDEVILKLHFFDTVEPMRIALASENNLNKEGKGGPGTELTVSQMGKLLLYGAVKAQMQVLWARLELEPSALDASLKIPLRTICQNLRVVLTRLSAIFEELAEWGPRNVDAVEFAAALDTSESCLKVLSLLLSSTFKYGKKATRMGQGETEGLVGSCLRIIFSIVALRVQPLRQVSVDDDDDDGDGGGCGANNSAVVASSVYERREFCQALLCVLREAPRSCLFLGLEEADAWASVFGDEGRPDAMASLLSAYLSFEVSCHVRICVTFLLTTPTYLPLIASFGKNQVSEFYSKFNGGCDCVEFALTRLGIPQSFAQAIFGSPEGGGEGAMEATVRAWALFSLYLKTLGKEDVKFMCLLLRQTDVVGDLLTRLSQYLPMPDKISGKRSPKPSPGAPSATEERVTLREAAMNSGLLEEDEYILQGSAAVYRSLLHVMPSSVCAWFTEIRDRQAITTIENYTSRRETPALIDLELETITSRGELQVLALQKKREIVARYKKDDSTLVRLSFSSLSPPAQ